MVERSVIGFARQNMLPLAVLVSAIAVATYFGFQVIVDILYFDNHRAVDVELQPWMTPRYVVMTYDLPRPLVFGLLDFDPDADRGIRLRQIAERQDLSMEQLTARVRSAAETYRETQP